MKDWKGKCKPLSGLGVGFVSESGCKNKIMEWKRIWESAIVLGFSGGCIEMRSSVLTANNWQGNKEWILETILKHPQVPSLESIAPLLTQHREGGLQGFAFQGLLLSS